MGVLIKILSTPKGTLRKINMELNWKMKFERSFSCSFGDFPCSRLFLSGLETPLFGHCAFPRQAGTFARRTSKTAASRNSREGMSLGDMWNFMVFSG